MTYNTDFDSSHTELPHRESNLNRYWNDETVLDKMYWIPIKFNHGEALQEGRIAI